MSQVNEKTPLVVPPSKRPILSWVLGVVFCVASVVGVGVLLCFTEFGQELLGNHGHHGTRVRWVMVSMGRSGSQAALLGLDALTHGILVKGHPHDVEILGLALPPNADPCSTC